MPERKALPDQLREKSGKRTDDAVSALHVALDAIRAEVRAADGDRPVTLKDVVARAGLGEKFLYSLKHKNTTKPIMEAAVAEINELSRRNRVSAEPVQSDLERARAEARYWKERYEKLARHGNLWFARMREQQRTIRELNLRVGGSVVRLVEKR